MRCFFFHFIESGVDKPTSVAPMMREKAGSELTALILENG